jgi:hypothetical protein
MTGRIVLGKLFGVAEIDAAGKVGAHVRAKFFLEPFQKFAAPQVGLHAGAHFVFYSAPVFQPDDKDAAGDDAAQRAARAHPAPEAGGRLEHLIVFQAEQLLPRADNSLRSVEKLVHETLDALTNLILDFSSFHWVSYPPWSVRAFPAVFTYREQARK